MNIGQERAEFEAWYVERYGEPTGKYTASGFYIDHEIQAEWRGWQARAALQSQDREDAERYRWLRDGGNDDIGVVKGFGGIDYGSTSVAYTYEDGLCGDDLDAAIDHARRVEGEGND